MEDKRQEYIKFFTHMQEEDKKIPLGEWLGMIFVGGFMMRQKKINCLPEMNWQICFLIY